MRSDTQARPSIDWQMVFDGRIWRLDFGIDYECSERKAADRARAAARRHGIKLKTACHFAARSVYVQAQRESLSTRSTSGS